MRHIVWLAGCLLLLSCTVNNDNLTADAGGTGGGSGGAGGCPRCVGTGGASATGGQVGTGGASATGGQTGTGGSGTGGHGAGGSGGNGGNAGSPGGKSCEALQSDYGTALTPAKKCTPGATNQCQQLVDSSLSCPGCKQYVNDTTTLSAIQAAWDHQNCGSVPRACPAIACLAPTTSFCVGTSPTTNGPNAGADPSGTCATAQLLTPTN